MLKNRLSFVYFLLGLIFILAFFLRIYNLASYPVGFHQDEASLGYNGYSLLLTGKDDNGNRFPLYIDMFGDNRPSGYHYLTILPIKFLGLTEFSTRFPGALFGSISIFAMYFLAISIFQNRKFGLLSAFLIAISPWHVVLSRASAEGVVALFFIIIGFAFLIKSIRTKKKMFLLIASILLVASFFFYHTPRVFVPAFFLLLLFMLFSMYKRSGISYLIGLVCAFLFISATAFLLVFFISGGTGRYSQVNIFGFPETKLVMDEQIREDGVMKNSILETRIFHNKIINYGQTFIGNYFGYFTGDFLFMKGGLPAWYIVPQMGLFYLVELPFIVLGVIFLVGQKKIAYKIPLFWLIFAPATAALTVDDIPNINRAFVMLPALELIIVYGFINFMQKIPNRLQKRIGIFIGICMLYNVSYFLHQYFVHAAIHRNWYRNEGVGEMVKTVRSSYKDTDKIVITKDTGGIYPLALFYMKFSPLEYQVAGSPKDKDYSGFGKFIFVPQDCPSIQRNDMIPKGKPVLYVDRGDCPWDESLAVKKYDYIYREDGTKAFRIVYE